MRPITHRHALAAVAVLSLFLNIFGIWWGLPNMPSAWAPDEINPLVVLEGIDERFSGGWWQLYPPLHHYLLALVALPAVLLDTMGLIELRLWTGYTILFYLFRFLSVLLGTGTVLLVYLCGRELFDRRSAVFAALVTAMICPLVYYAKTANPEMAYYFWSVLSLLLFIRVLKYHELRDYLGLAAAAVFAMCTKDQAFAFYVLMPLPIGWSAYARHRQTDSTASFAAAFLNRRTLSAGVLAVVLFVTIHNLLFNWGGFVDHFRANFGAPTFDETLFPNTISGRVAVAGLGLRHLLFVLGWPVLTVCTVGLVRALLQWRQNTRLLALLVPIASFWIFLINIVLFHYDRYSVLTAVTLALFGGPVLAGFTAPGARWRVARAATVGSLFLYTFVYCFSVNNLIASDSRYEVERWMKRTIPDGDLVLTVGYSMYLPRMDRFTWTWTVRPTEEELLDVAPDYVVTTSNFDERRFLEGSESFKYFDGLKTGKLGYSLVFQHQGKPKWNLLSFDDIHSNLDKINPEINIYKRLF